MNQHVLKTNARLAMCLAIMLLCFARVSMSQGIVLDPTFGTNGTTFTNFRQDPGLAGAGSYNHGNSYDVMTAALTQPDGKFVAVGTYSMPNVNGTEPPGVGVCRY